MKGRKISRKVINLRQNEYYIEGMDERVYKINYPQKNRLVGKRRKRLFI